MVEALLAMTILGIAATAIMTTFSGSLIAGKTSQDYAVASMLLDDLRAYVRTDMLTPVTENQGAFTNYPNYAWEVIYTLSEVSNLYNVEMIIVWQRGMRMNRISATTYHYFASDTEESMMGASEGRGR